jgi:hypothetical protein
MFCKNCGRQLDEGENICPACGTVNASETTATPNAGIEYAVDAVDLANERLKDEMAGAALKWGIISLAFSASACLSLLGFIFSFIAKSRALAYQNVFGVLEGKAKVGRILGKVGFGLGLGLTIYMAFAVMLGVIIGLSEAGAL